MSEFFEAGVCAVPSNFGPLKDWDGRARITGPCGDTMEFWVSIADNRIEDARYTTDGCMSSHICGSLAALLVRGLTIDEALLLNDKELLKRSVGVAEDSAHCATLAVTTLREAIADWRRRNHSLLRSGKKVQVQTRSILNPKPHLVVSCRDEQGRNNALVVVYACNCSYDPPSLMVGIVPTRFSYPMIKKSGCFVVNLVTPNQKDLYDYFGSHSGRDEDKMAISKAKWTDGSIVNAPLLSDCPVCIECSVVNSINCGSHDMFVGKIEVAHADEELVGSDGFIDWSRFELL